MGKRNYSSSSYSSSSSSDKGTKKGRKKKRKKQNRSSSSSASSSSRSFSEKKGAQVVLDSDDEGKRQKHKKEEKGKSRKASRSRSRRKSSLQQHDRHANKTHTSSGHTRGHDQHASRGEKWKPPHARGGNRDEPLLPSYALKLIPKASAPVCNGDRVETPQGKGVVVWVFANADLLVRLGDNDDRQNLRFSPGEVAKAPDLYVFTELGARFCKMVDDIKIAAGAAGLDFPVAGDRLSPAWSAIFRKLHREDFVNILVDQGVLRREAD